MVTSTKGTFIKVKNMGSVHLPMEAEKFMKEPMNMISGMGKDDLFFPMEMFTMVNGNMETCVDMGFIPTPVVVNMKESFLII
mmetsp:Transcript_15143/g.20764  ORF Transcript_15143/g.20764 Transcript_15143/m.20764 type:complete len:82 (-) Transcript_15143:1033-1278(-)